MSYSFSDLTNKIIISVVGLEEGSDYIRLNTFDGMSFVMYHEQDCCENVEVADICGDVDDLLHAPIIEAYESTSNAEDVSESGTWTFYHIQTTKGSIVIRWLGESNGYYSESVTFKKID